jgi:hypothetical protein
MYLKYTEYWEKIEKIKEKTPKYCYENLQCKTWKKRKYVKWIRGFQKLGGKVEESLKNKTRQERSKVETGDPSSKLYFL